MRLRSKGAILLCCLFPLVGQAIEQNPTKPMPQFEVSTNLNADDPQEFENPMFFKVGASCRVDTHGKLVHFDVQVLKGGGVVNGKHYSSHDHIQPIPAKDGDRFEVSANASAKVRLMLMKEEGGVDNITAHCSVKL